MTERSPVGLGLREGGGWPGAGCTSPVTWGPGRRPKPHAWPFLCLAFLPRGPSLCPVNIPFPRQGFFLFFLPVSATRLDFLVNFLLMTSNFPWLNGGEREASHLGQAGERARSPAWAWQWVDEVENTQAEASGTSGTFLPEQRVLGV